MIVVGTAGHIDHGKSAIIKRLTGTDPDRLPEEKKRGLTIDLGFAFYRTGEGIDIGFVDVPGHERFVKNMIAGAGGIDSVMLVIAADDGWMPQSQEHFQIVRLLGVKHGFIVINKCDLVEKDWLDLLEAEIAEKVEGSFLDGAPMFRVSAETGEGFDALREHLEHLPGEVRARAYTGTARLSIDRSFVRPGMGGVVTGTLRGDELSTGQTVGVWPAQKTGRIRSLQSQKQEVERVTPGQRTAVSLTGIEKEDLPRGGIITSRVDLSHFAENPVLALSVEMLPEAPVPLENDRDILMLAGTAEMEGVIRLYGADVIGQGQRGLVFFKPEAPMYTLVGDHYIMRLPTPMETLGGGRVLDHLPRIPRRRDMPHFGYLVERLNEGLAALAISELRKQTLQQREGVLEYADFPRADIDRELDILLDSGTVQAHGKHLFLADHMNQVAERFKRAIEDELKEKSHLKGLLFDQVAGLSPVGKEKTATLLDYLVETDILEKTGDLYNLAGRTAKLKGVIKQAYEDIMSQLQAQPYTPPALSDFAGRGKNYQQAIKYILDTGEAHKCGADFLFLQDTWREFAGFIADRLKSGDQLAVTDLRDRFNITRKFAIPILEETDRIGLTKRQGDVRTKGDLFENALAGL